MKILKILFPIFFVLCASWFIIRPLTIAGFFPMHDDTQVARVFEMGKALTDRMFPVRWVADLGFGYGYPIFTFYAPLAYYIGGLFVSFGVDPLFATKIMIGIGMLLSGVFMYLFCKEVWGKAGGVIGGVFYAYATYHAVELYVRGDFAELFAYAFIPLAAYGVMRSFRQKNIASLFIGSLGFAGLIISHNLTAFMAAPFLFVFAGILSFLLWRKTKRLSSSLSPFYSLLGGVALSAFYWLPVFGEMKYTNVLSQIGGSADFRNHFVCLSQLWYSPWGYGGSVSGCVDGLSFMVGKLHIILSVLTIPLAIFLFRKKSTFAWWVTGGLIGLLVSVFLVTSFSRSIWEAVSFMSFFQYPWRFLVLISFFSSFLAAGFMLFFRGRIVRIALVIGMVGAVIGLQSKFFMPQRILPASSSAYVSVSALRWKASNISNEYMPKGFQKPDLADKLPNAPFTALHAEKGIIFIVEDKTQRKTAIIDSQTPAVVEVFIAYFPAWRLFVDKVEAPYVIEKNGLSIMVPAGRHTVTAEYVETPVEQTANWLTLTSIIFFILGIIYQRNRYYHGK